MTLTRRQFLRSTLIGSVPVLCGPPISLPPALSQAESKRRPNIMVVIGDDMTCEDCEPYGSRHVLTPNMARLAREGMCFDAMSTATAMCAPTRQQLYTGLYPIRNGAYPNHSKVYEGTRSLPHYLKALGYRVGLIGKKHFGPPESFPFEILPAKGADEGASNTEAIAKFVNRDAAQPYCLIVASNQPHGPWNLGDPSAYKADEITVPPYLVDCPRTREDLVKYYAEITYLDGQLGGCMKVIDESGRAENTILIFTSEQGSSMPFGAKWTCYEMGLKTAFIVRWPAAVEAGTRNRAMTQYVDVTPTLLEAAGGTPQTIDTGRPDAYGNTGFDGRSFLNVLLGKTDKHRDYVYGAHTTRGIINGSACYPIRSLRSERYKYIWNPNYQATFYNVVATNPNDLLQAWKKLGETDPAVAARAEFYQHRPEEELYDLQTDPYELKNLAGEPAYAPIKAQLRKELDRWMKQQGDEGNATEMKALERQGPNRKWTPYDPSRVRKSDV